MIRVLALAGVLVLGACASSDNDVDLVRKGTVTEYGLLTVMFLSLTGLPGEAIAAAAMGRPSIFEKVILNPVADIFCANPRDAKTGNCT